MHFLTELAAKLLKRLRLFSYNTRPNGGTTTLQDARRRTPARLRTKLSTGLFRATGSPLLPRPPPWAVFILLLSTVYNKALPTGTYAAAPAPQVNP